VTRALATAALLMAACKNDEHPLDAAEGSVPGDATELDANALLFTVVPAEQRTSTGDIRAFTQDFGPFLADEIDGGVNADLDPPVRFSGRVIGEQVTPYDASGGLPTVEVAVAGHVEIADERGIVFYTTATDPVTGDYALDLLPGEWEARVVPDDASLAPGWSLFGASGPPVSRDFALDPEQAIYGQVLVDGDPYLGAEVFAVDAFGRTSGVAVTDSGGFYALRVPAGVWEVTTTGVPAERDPAIHAADVVVTNRLGAPVDLSYPGSGRVLATLQVRSADDSPVGGIPVRFTAVALDGYGDAQLVVEAEAASDGRVDLPLVPGVYDIEILPGDVALVGWRADGVDIHSGGTIDTVALDPLVPISGVTVEATGLPLAGVRVTCDEIGFAGRTWSTFSDDSGVWSLTTAPLVSCAAVPPGGRSDLAIERLVIDAGETTSWTPQLAPGREITGVVTLDGEPEAFAVVEVRNAAGQIVGQGLSDGDGLYNLALPLIP
jgi:hypothetical protein